MLSKSSFLNSDTLKLSFLFPVTEVRRRRKEPARVELKHTEIVLKTPSWSKKLNRLTGFGSTAGVNLACNPKFDESNFTYCRKILAQKI